MICPLKVEFGYSSLPGRRQDETIPGSRSAGWERVMKIQEVILRALAKKIIPRGGTSGGDSGDLRAQPAALAVAVRAVRL